MKKNGFTLIEVLIAMILVGLAIASLVGANISFTRANGAGANLSTAEFLIEQIRGRTALIEYDNLHSSFDNVQFSPPVSTDGQALADFAEFTQAVTVENVSNTNFETVVSDFSSDFVRITVRILLNSDELSSASWIRADIGS